MFQHVMHVAYTLFNALGAGGVVAAIGAATISVSPPLTLSHFKFPAGPCVYPVTGYLRPERTWHDGGYPLCCLRLSWNLP